MHGQLTEITPEFLQIFAGYFLVWKDENTMFGMELFDVLNRFLIERLVQINSGDFCAKKDADLLNRKPGTGS